MRTLALGLAVVMTAIGCSACEHRGERRGASAASSAGLGKVSTSAKNERGPKLELARGGNSRVTVYVPARLVPAPPARGQKRPRLSKQEALALTRLQESVTDLARYLQAISGAEVPLVTGAPPADASTIPVLVAELAQERFGPPALYAPGAQGFRVIVREHEVGLYGESDLATSYAIYEVLDRLGCRWFMPGELGEEIPHNDTPSLLPSDDSLAPSTTYRNIWYADAAFQRRNRLGGLQLAAGHQLERWITSEQRAEHPEWRAVINGAPHPTRLRWSDPEVASAVADGIDAAVDKRHLESASLSPGDGVDFDQGDDQKLDAGDWDPSVNSVSLTDRLLVLVNRVAQRVTVWHPDLLLGLLAYANYTRPPVRERVHPNVVPVIAPITYCRQHPISDDSCPGAKDLRAIVTGWAAKANQLAFRSYAYNLAEPAAPHPMLRKWSEDLPFMFAHKVRFFQPETLANFETTLPALYLGIRLSWDKDQAPAAIEQELFDRFYGSASKETRAYIELIDRAWTETQEYSGGGLGYGRRFPPAFLERARSLLEKAKRACKTERESARVAMLDASLGQLETYMHMFWALRSGKLDSLANDSAAWQARAGELAERYAANFAFGKARWAGPNGVNGGYFKRFLEPRYEEATELARTSALLTPLPLCTLSYRKAPSLALPFTGDPSSSMPMTESTDVCRDTWSTLGLDEYFGGMWYQTDLALPTMPPGKRSFIWLSAVDGVAQVWLNGKALAQKDAVPGAITSAEVHLKSLTFELTPAALAGTNQLQIAVKRSRLAELGAGGLLGPLYAYRER